MRKSLPIATLILMSLTLSACSSLGTTRNFVATLSSETDEDCSPFGDSGLETCIVSMDIKNITTSPQRISGTIYGYADGKVYKAANWLTNSIDFYEDTLNPGETRGSVVAFDIPKGSTLTKVFVGPTSDPNDAIMTLELNLLAHDNLGYPQDAAATPEPKSNASGANPRPPRWVPAGYTVWVHNSNIAWRFANKGSYKCDEYRCIAIDFISEKGCQDGLDVDLKWVDLDDDISGYDSASLRSLNAMQPAKLKFDDEYGIGEFGEILNISCQVEIK